VEIRRAADHVTMPWANGQGTTLELAVHPPGATAASMEWRISVATVAAPGPFSSLPGVDRVLLMLDDVDAVLSVDGTAFPLRQFDQVVFSGDADVALASVSSPARDLNLMTRRGRWAGRMTRIDLAAAGHRSGADHTWLLVVSGTAHVADGDAWTLGELDLALLSDDAEVRGSGVGVLLEIVRDQ
jgi:uncharacterized protein